MCLSYLIQLDKCLWNSKYSLKAYAEPNCFGTESYDKSEVNNPEKWGYTNGIKYSNLRTHIVVPITKVQQTDHLKYPHR